MLKKSRINQPIRLFYWSEIKFIHKEKENYGDFLSRYLVEKISGRPVRWVHPKKIRWYKRNKKNYLAIGSIIHHATKKSIVWGSGIIDRKQKVAPADFRAVRGPQTRKYLLEQGYDCPEIYGDPAILMPELYKPEVFKEYEMGIIPHYHDYKIVKELYKDENEILIIDMMTMDVEKITKQIMSCKKTISSSLHGIIVSHAYGIPSLWVKFSDKIFGDDIKYIDYLESVKLQAYEPPFITSKLGVDELKKLLESLPSEVTRKHLEELKRGLMGSSPF